MAEDPVILVATPRTKPITDSYHNSLWMSNFIGGLDHKILPNLAVDVARDHLVGVSKDRKVDAVLWADIDASWHPDAIQRLWDRNVDIVCGIMYRRALPPIPTIGYYQGKNPKGQHVYDLGSFADKTRQYLMYQQKHQGMGENFPNDLCFPIEHPGEMVEVDGIGSHFVLIRKRVFEALPPPWYKCTTPSAGEDYWFCRKAKAAGFKIWADMTVHTGHEVGTGIDFGAREFIAMMKYTDKIDTTQEYWEMGAFDK